jgi:Type II CAAX prenyl endopeptidase Rce1-like
MVVLLLGRWSPRVAFLLPTTLAESIGWSVVAITAGICEEIVYRGYLQRQLSAFTGRSPLPFACRRSFSAQLIFTRDGNRLSPSSWSGSFWDQSQPGAAALFPG